MPAGHLGAVGRGRARPDHGHRRRRARRAAPDPRTHRPSGAPPRSLHRLDGRRGRRAAAATPRRRGPRTGCPAAPPARGRASGRARRAAGDVGEQPAHVALGGEVLVDPDRAELGDQPGQPRVARLGERGTARPGPAGRPRSRSSGRASPTRGGQQRGRRTAAGARCRPRPAPGRSTPAQVGDRPRQPVHADGAAPAEPAGVQLVVEPPLGVGASGHSSRSSGPGVWELSRQLRPA